MHEKRLTRGADLHAAKQERLPPEERFLLEAIRLADCDSEDDREYSRRKDDVRRAARRWLLSEGWRPPVDDAEVA